MTNSPLVLVTGGAGFIGSHTVDLLLSRGYRVRVLDNLQPRVHPRGKPSWLPDRVEFMQGDVADRRDLGRALEGVEYVQHLAAYQDYLPEFSLFVRTNTESTALLFELIVGDRRRYPVRKIVFASSQSVCGEGRYFCPRCGGGHPCPSLHDQLADAALVRALPAAGIRVPGPRPVAQLRAGDWEVRCPACREAMTPVLIDESTCSPGTTYAVSKYAIELLADRLGRRYGIPTACMRYTYVQGTRNSFYNAYSGIARRFSMQLLHDQPPQVYEDGAQLRDYVNVRDVARANVLVMERDAADFGVFNVGGGRAITVLQFAELMIREFGSSLRPRVHGEFRLGDTRHTVSDISALRRLGWQPEVPVEQNVSEYVAWIREQHCTPEYLDEAERVMREQGVVQQAGVQPAAAAMAGA